MLSVGTVHHSTVHLVHGGQWHAALGSTQHTINYITLRARCLSLSFSDFRPDYFVWSNPGMSERENRLLLRGPSACSCCVQLCLVSLFPCVPPHPFGRSPTRVVRPEGLERSRSPWDLMCYSRAISGIAHRVPLLRPHFRAARHVASYTLCYLRSLPGSDSAASDDTLESTSSPARNSSGSVQNFVLTAFAESSVCCSGLRMSREGAINSFHMSKVSKAYSPLTSWSMVPSWISTIHGVCFCWFPKKSNASSRPRVMSSIALSRACQCSPKRLASKALPKA